LQYRDEDLNYAIEITSFSHKIIVDEKSIIRFEEIKKQNFEKFNHSPFSSDWKIALRILWREQKRNKSLFS